MSNQLQTKEFEFFNNNLSTQEKEKCIFAPYGSEAIVLKELCNSDYNFIIYIASCKKSIQLLVNNFLSIEKDINILYFPAWDVKPYDYTDISPIIMHERIKTLYQISNSKKSVIITSIEAISQKLPPLESITPLFISTSSSYDISVNRRESILKYLNNSGYQRESVARAFGEYAVRGGILDITINNRTGLRIDFLGNNIDTMRLFDLETQFSNKEKITDIEIYPVTEIIFKEHLTDNLYSDSVKNQKNINDYRQKKDINLNAAHEFKRNNIRFKGLEHFLPLFFNNPTTFFDFIPKNNKSLILLESDFSLQILEMDEKIQSRYEARCKFKAEEENIPSPLPPFTNTKSLYLHSDEIKSHLTANKKQQVMKLNRFPIDDEKTFMNVPKLYETSKVKNQPYIATLLKYLNNPNQYNLNQPQRKDQKNISCIIACNNDHTLKKIAFMLENHQEKIYYKNIDNILSYQELTSSSLIDANPDNIKPSIYLTQYSLEHGFIHNNKVIFSYIDVIGKQKLSKIQRKKKASQRFLQEMGTIQNGDLIVHSTYGIGKFIGLETLHIDKLVHDFIKIEYSDNDKLYLPVENLDLVTRYGGNDESNTALDKLGGASWQVRKSKIKERIKIMAQELLSIAAKRQLSSAPILLANDAINSNSNIVIDGCYEEFCNSFPYVETEDQLTAIEDVENDLSTGYLMDRLICGDVGFGKTEVALRAACIAVINGVQVAVIVPTTLLARQHFATFLARFKSIKSSINIKQLSRFVSTKEAKLVKEGLNDGSINIVIGTHALFSKDVVFQNLGLIVVDEEQHFGVKQKESLKKMRANSHILTLSATPIPRTLQMSLVGIRDLSLITTPPVDKQPIKTFIIDFDPLLIRDAILYELQRNGRVFYVTPRITYLEKIREKLESILPNVKFKVAHGKMSPSILSNIMSDFYDGKFDVLISTVIIESGIDIRNANTIIIDKADMFGLSQLYQIRGRVGRSDIKSYAYLIRSKSNLSQNSHDRLNAIQSLEALGSGFSIASYDMDARGYGNIVGEEQSGHVKDIGIEMYQEMLMEAIEETKLQKAGATAADEDISNNSFDNIDNRWSPVINIGISIQIPISYISEDNLRVNLYKRIAKLETNEEVENFSKEMTDRFGPMPIEAKHLFDIIKLKQLAKQLKITKLDAGSKGIVITLHENCYSNLNNISLKINQENSSFIDMDKILHLAQTRPHEFKIKPDHKIVITKSWNNDEDKLKGIEDLLKSLTLSNRNN